MIATMWNLQRLEQVGSMGILYIALNRREKFTIYPKAMSQGGHCGDTSQGKQHVNFVFAFYTLSKEHLVLLL